MAEETGGLTADRPRGASSRPGIFVVRCFILLALTGLFYWIGWRSPWARADQHVRVDIVDPPPATETPMPAASTSSVIGEMEGGPNGPSGGSEGASIRSNSVDEDHGSRTKRHRRNRNPRRVRTETEGTNDDAVD